jgi:hypothetical protein
MMVSTMRLTSRALERLIQDFPERPDEARYVIESVNIGSDDTAENSKRIQTAMLICAAGNLNRLLDAASIAETDWRDLLVNAELADDDWRDGVNAYLAAPATGE